MSTGLMPGRKQADEAIADGEAQTSTATGAITSVPAPRSSPVRARRSSSLMKYVVPVAAAFVT